MITLPNIRLAKWHFLLAGLALAAAGQYFLSVENLPAGLVLYALSLPPALYGLVGAPDRPCHAETAGAPPAGGAARWLAVVIAVVAVAAELLLLYAQREGRLASGTVWPLCMACWGLFGVALLVRSRRWEPAGLLGLLLLAIALRGYGLDTMPYGLWGDEGNDGMESLRVLSGQVVTPFATDWGGNPLLHQWVNALFFMIFGATPLAYRLVAAVAGVLSIVLTYVLGRDLWGPRVGLFSGFLVAVSRWHLWRSRHDNVVIQGLPFQLLAFIFFFRGLKSRRLTDFALCGLAGGLALNFYHGIGIAPVILAVCLIYELFPRPLPALKRYWKGAALAGVTALFVFAPLGAFFLGNPQALYGRANSVLVFNQVDHFRSQYPKLDPTPANMLLAQSISTALMFNYQGDKNPTSNWEWKPQLDPLTGVLFVIGVAYALWRWKDRRNFFLLTWVGLTMVTGSVLTVGAPQAVRTVGAIPGVMLLAGLAGDRIWERVRAGIGRAGRTLVAIAAAVCIGLIGHINIDSFFNGYLLSRGMWYGRSSVSTTAGNYLRPLAAGYRVSFLWTDDLHSKNPVLQFVAGSLDALDFGSPTGFVPVRQPTDKGVIFIGLDPALPTLLHFWYPGGTALQYNDPWDNPMFWGYRVEADEIAAHRGLNARYYDSLDWSGTPVLQRVDSQIAFAGAGAGLLDMPFSAEWEGTLAGEGLETTLALETEVAGRVELDGQTIIDGAGGGRARVLLAKGQHRLRVRAVFPNGPRPIMLAWAPLAEGLRPVPANVLGTWNDAPGLWGAYYGRSEPGGAAEFYSLDPLMSFRWSRSTDPLPMPFSAEWQGTIRIDTAGEYSFGVATRGNRAAVWIDEAAVAENDGQQGDRVMTGAVTLAAGEHPIRVRYQAPEGGRGLYVYWTPPGGQTEILPIERLTPAVPQGVAAPAS